MIISKLFKFTNVFLFINLIFPIVVNAQIGTAEKLNHVSWVPSYAANEDLIPTLYDYYNRFKSKRNLQYSKSDQYSVCRGQDQDNITLVGRLRFSKGSGKDRFVCAAIPNSLAKLTSDLAPKVTESGIQLNERGEILLESFDVLQYSQAPSYNLSVVQEISAYRVRQDAAYLNSLVSVTESEDTVRPICIANVLGAYEYYSGGRQMISPQMTRYTPARTQFVPTQYQYVDEAYQKCDVDWSLPAFRTESVTVENYGYPYTYSNFILIPVEERTVCKEATRKVYKKIKDAEVITIPAKSEIIPAVFEDKAAGWYWNDKSKAATYIGELDSRSYCKYINKGGRFSYSTNYNLLTNPAEFALGDKTQAIADSPKWVRNFGNTWPYNEAGIVNLSLIAYPDIKIKVAKETKTLKPAILPQDVFVCRDQQTRSIGYVDADGYCLTISDTSDEISRSIYYDYLVSQKPLSVMANNGETSSLLAINPDKNNPASGEICLMPHTNAGMTVGFRRADKHCRGIAVGASLIVDSTDIAQTFTLVKYNPASVQSNTYAKGLSLKTAANFPKPIAQIKNITASDPICGDSTKNGLDASAQNGYAQASLGAKIALADGVYYKACTTLQAGAKGDISVDKSGIAAEAWVGALVKSTQEVGAETKIPVVGVKTAGKGGIESQIGAYANGKGGAGWDPDKMIGVQFEGGAFAKADVTVNGSTSVGIGNNKAGVGGGVSSGGVGAAGGGSAKYEDGVIDVGASVNLALAVGVNLNFNIKIDTKEVADAAKKGGIAAVNGTVYLSAVIKDGVSEKPVKVALSVVNGSVVAASKVSDETYNMALKTADGVLYAKEQMVGNVAIVGNAVKDGAYKVKDGVLSIGKPVETFTANKVLPAASRVGDGVVYSAYKISDLAGTGYVAVSSNLKNASGEIVWATNAGADQVLWTAKEAGRLGRICADGIMKAGGKVADWASGAVGTTEEAFVSTGNTIKGGLESFGNGAKDVLNDAGDFFEDAGSTIGGWFGF